MLGTLVTLGRWCHVKEEITEHLLLASLSNRSGDTEIDGTHPIMKFTVKLDKGL